MEKAEVISIMRRFIRNSCPNEEIVVAVTFLKHARYRKWFGELMDEATIEPAEISDEQIENSFSMLERKLGPVSAEAKSKHFPWPLLFRIAAVMTGFILVAGLAIYYLKTADSIRYETGFGEIRTITLPDGSEVTLNGNTTVQYEENEAGIRTAKLVGEAFFKVHKTPDHRKFILTMPEAGVIEVLGTEFNVNHRASGSQVMLRTGSIRLSVGHGKIKEVVMKPGDLVEVSRGVAHLTRKKVDPALHDAWKSRKLVFENTPLHEITRMLTDVYGLEIVIGNQELLNKKLSGTAPIQSVDIFLEALSGSFDLQIHRRKNKVFIQAR